MKTCLLFGAFGYLGFELTQKLLEKGLEVVHVDIGDEFEPPDYVVEKELRVGRNANLSVIKEETIRWQQIDTIIIPVCDWGYFPDDKKEVLANRLKQHLSGNHADAAKQVIIHPVHATAIPAELEVRAHLSIIVPDLYGGWQPPASLFYDLLLQGDELDLPEETINIHDAASTICELIETREGQFILKNQDKRRQKQNNNRFDREAVKTGNDGGSGEVTDENGRTVVLIATTEDEAEVVQKMKRLIPGLAGKKKFSRG